MHTTPGKQAQWQELPVALSQHHLPVQHSSQAPQPRQPIGLRDLSMRMSRQAQLVRSCGV